MSEYPVLRFLNALFWEFIQNLGLVPSVAAVWLWARRERGRAVLTMLLSAATFSGAIFFTESAKVGRGGHMDTMLVNMLVLSALMFLIIPYLGAEAKWSNRKTDWAVGLAAGVCVALAQGLASPGRSPLVGILLHSVALGVAGAIILVNMRLLKHKGWWAALGSALLLVVVMTLIFGLIDYSYLLI